MIIDEDLIQLITKKVIEEIQKSDLNIPADKSVFETAARSQNVKEVVIGVGPAFGSAITKTISGLELSDVLKEISSGIEEEGMDVRVVKVFKTSDVAFIGKEAATLSGSGFSIGLQSKGTAVIHHRDLYPLTNLELFPQAPLMTLEAYRKIGRNAAKYVKGEKVLPIEIQNDPMVRSSYQVKAAIMHIKETEFVDKNKMTAEFYSGLL